MWGQSTWRRDADGEKVHYRYYGCASGAAGRTDHRVTVPAGPIERFIVRKLRAVYEGTDLRADVASILAAKGAAQHEGAAQERDLIARRIGQINRALRNVSRRILMVEDDELAKQMLAEAGRLKAELAGIELPTTDWIELLDLTARELANAA